MNSNHILDADFHEKKENRIPIEIVNVNKFVLLSVLSLGLYPIWWMYKIWKFYQEKEGLDIMPVMRAIFAIFFLYSLMEKNKTYAKSFNYSEDYPSLLLFIGFVASNLLSQLPEPLSLMSVFGLVFFIPPLKAFNFALEKSEEYDAIDQPQFNTRQLILMAVGGLLWLATIAGVYLPN